LKKIIFIILGTVMLFFVGIFVYFITIYLALKIEISNFGQKNDAEFTHKATQECEVIRRELEEKYRKDVIAFEAKYKELEKEKRIRIDLEKKAQDLEKKGQKIQKKR